LGSPKDNVQDCINKGRHSGCLCCLRGEDSPLALLTNEQAAAIRAAGNYCNSVRLIGIQYGVSGGVISSILRNKTYRDA
jgi:hypothetical protein